MHPELEKIKAAAHGLLFMSESDYPFEIVQLNGNSVEDELKKMSDKEGPITKQNLDDFFRSSTTAYATDGEEQKQNVQRFTNLKKVLSETLNDAQVYRIGSVQIDAFIIGQLSNGSFGGLKTKLVET
ncbi:MAG: nuclease [Chitinophagaceae bacterium]